MSDLAYSPALAALRSEIEDFLYREADLLDDRRFDEWLALFADDLVYRMPMVRNVRATLADEQYRNQPLDVAWFDEGKDTLVQRVAQVRTGVHWAEEPASRTVHSVSNVRVVGAMPSVERAQEVDVLPRVGVSAPQPGSGRHADRASRGLSAQTPRRLGDRAADGLCAAERDARQYVELLRLAADQPVPRKHLRSRRSTRLATSVARGDGDSILRHLQKY